MPVYDPSVNSSPVKPVDDEPEPGAGAEPLLPRVQERLLLEWLKNREKTATKPFLQAGQRLLCNTLGRGQLAAQMALEAPQALVNCHFFDLFSQRLVQETLAAGSLEGHPTVFPPNLSLACQPDLILALCRDWIEKNEALKPFAAIGETIGSLHPEGYDDIIYIAARDQSKRIVGNDLRRAAYSNTEEK